MVELIEDQIHQALIKEEEERCRVIEEKNKLDPEKKDKKVTRRIIQKPWSRGIHPRLCQETELLLKVCDYNYELGDPRFRNYCQERGVLHIAGEVGSRRWDFCVNHSQSFGDYLNDARSSGSESADTDDGKPPDAESEIGWKIVRIARAKLQDCWEMFVALDKSSRQP
jgi:hypothetical protein